MYAPLNVKTSNYLLTSMIKIKDLIKIAKDNNLKALAITDNNMYGALEFYNLCLQNQIKPIIGLEVSIPEKILLYAKNYQGYQNLIKLTTIKSEQELTTSDLAKYSSDLVCILPYTGRKRYHELVKLYENFFIGYQTELEKSKINSSNTVYIPETLCLTKEDEKYLKYLKAIKEGKTIDEIEDPQNKSLLPIKELDKENNQKIINLCNLKIQKYKDLIEQSKGDKYENIITKDLQDKIKMIQKIITKDFTQTKNLTVKATHGDYNVLQFIYENGKIKAIIDFASAAKLPVVWEIIRSYSYLDKECQNGKINIPNLIDYIKEYLKYSELNEYDLKYMPFIYLTQLLNSTYGYKQYLQNHNEELLKFGIERTNYCRNLLETSDEISKILLKLTL